MTNTMPDDQHQRIIEAATLGLKLWHINDEGEELEQANRAFQAALSQLPEDSGTVMMVIKLLDGKPYSITSDSPDNIQRCIAIAQKIGATVEDSASPFADALPPGLRTIRINPPSHQAVTRHHHQPSEDTMTDSISQPTDDIRVVRDMALAVMTKRGVREDTGLGPTMESFRYHAWRIVHVEPWEVDAPHALMVWCNSPVTRNFVQRWRWIKVLDVRWWNDDDAIEVKAHRRRGIWEPDFERTMLRADEVASP